MSRLHYLLPLLLLSQFSIFCHPGNLSVQDAYSPAPLNDRSAAIYFRIENDTGESIVLTGGHTEVARKVEMHRTEISNGLVRMVRLPEIPVASGESLEFRPGGLHFMLVDLTGIPEAGTEIELTITFKNQPDRIIRIPVVSPGDALE